MSGGVVVQGVNVTVTPDEIQKTFDQIAPTVSVVPIFSGSHEVSRSRRRRFYPRARAKT